MFQFAVLCLSGRWWWRRLLRGWRFLFSEGDCDYDDGCDCDCACDDVDDVVG